MILLLSIDHLNMIRLSFLVDELSRNFVEIISN